MKSITATELNEWKKGGKSFQLIDIRESYEVETCTIGGQVIPMDQILSSISSIRNDIPVVIHCNSGKRSSAVIYALEQKTDLQNLYSLEGGILAWINEVDPSLAGQ